MSKTKQREDLQILIGMSRTGDPYNLGCQIENNYLLRETMENLRESGFEIAEEYIPEQRSDLEKDIWKANYAISELEARRINKPKQEYPRDEEDISLNIKSRTYETI